ncbi:MAG: bifunctional nuclease family protein [Muribaculaceae bacterium]|nr:bifunctional nuclease family protein [Muribaculaceae bacterium]
MEDKYRLELIGITYNQIESGVYALILQQVGTKRRIPIIIGFPEAQAIECKLQEIKTPRPLTHDIMLKIIEEFGIELKYVLIHRLDDGVFAGELHLSDGISERVIDARSSDAVALAIRCGAPIYTTEDVINEASFDPSEKRRPMMPPPPTPFVEINNDIEKENQTKTGYDKMTIQELMAAMDKAAKDEDYEEAAKIQNEIKKRENNG